MVGTLTLFEKIKGKTKEELIHLLGDPLSKEANEWYYNLDPSGSGISYGALNIQFKWDRSVGYKVIVQ